MIFSHAITLIAMGLLSGVASGLLGIGGGIVMTTLLALVYGYSQHLAQGTSLAVLLFPVGLLGVLSYSQKGMIAWSAVPWIALGLVLGALLGAKLALYLPELMLKKVFGIFFLLVSLKMIFSK